MPTTKKTQVPEPVSPKPSEPLSPKPAEPIGCFVTGTTVLTDHGPRPIETIFDRRPGGWPATRSGVSRRAVPVTAVMTYPHRAVLRVEWDGGGVLVH